MKKMFFVFGVLVLVGFVSAGFVEDVFGGEDFNCENGKIIFEESYVGFDIPSAIPFSDEVFGIYVDDEFFASVELVEKSVVGLSCEVFENITYDVYVDDGLIEEISSGFSSDDIVDFYNEKRASGELEIDAVGLGRSLKMGVVNFGMKVAGWFS